MSTADDPYASSSFIGHSLWMCPSGAAKDAYQEIVADAARELDTFEFIPHITLVAAVMTSPQDVVERTKRLASMLAPYTFELDSVSHKDKFFQSVFVKMKQSPDVMHANQVARQFFPERQSDPEYMPHLSLLYGNFSVQQKEESIVPKLRQEIHAKAPVTTSFTVDSIEVWSTQGEAREWYLVETVPLTGGTNDA